MQIVNINNIEDLIIAKYEIEKIKLANKEIEFKSTIEEFLTNTAKVDYIYVYKGINIPFGFHKINNEDYLFVTNDDKQQIEILLTKLKLIKYNMNNLIKLSNLELSKIEDLNMDDFIIINNGYYK